MIMTDTTDTLDVKNFRKDVLNKLSYKGPSHSSKEAILIKIFKFYDLNASGALNQMEFLKSIAKIGVVLNSKEVCAGLFRKWMRCSLSLQMRILGWFVIRNSLIGLWRRQVKGLILLVVTHRGERRTNRSR